MNVMYWSKIDDGQFTFGRYVDFPKKKSIRMKKSELKSDLSTTINWDDVSYRFDHCIYYIEHIKKSNIIEYEMFECGEFVTDMRYTELKLSSRIKTIAAIHRPKTKKST